MDELVLGLDVGANSIGWFLVEPLHARIVDRGVRVFPEGVDNFDTKKEKPKMEARRVARGMRRQIARRAGRKRALRKALVAGGLLPSDRAKETLLDAMDPYVLRGRALSGPLALHEFGRALIHLNQRRGFKSNRKSDRGRKADDKGMLGEINQLAADMEKAGRQSIGEHLAKLHEDPHARVRHRHTRRDMYVREFELCWEAQRGFHPAALTPELKAKLHGILFFQRKMYWPASVIGRCELEPRQPRCPRADRLAQRFRLLQEVNNLRYYDPDLREERPLTLEQRTLLLDKLSRSEKMDFNQIRKALGFLATIEFNLERGKRKAIKGMPTDAALAGKELFGKGWHDLAESRKNEIVGKLIDAPDEGLAGLAIEWQLSMESVEALAKVDFPEGYASLGKVALAKLLPHMERGLLYMTDDKTPCALIAAGYLRPDQRERKVLGELPEPPDIANPVVRQALYEVRKVVNAIIREHGKPARIHIELARDATMSIDKRQEASKRRQDNEDNRSWAADLIRNADIRDFPNGIKVSRDGIDRVLLWRAQGEHCVYSGRQIGMRQLLQGEVDIDHILPYSRCLDDSMQNKVLAFRVMNQEKGNRTPREWLESDPERYEQVLQQASKLSYPKRQRFTQKELDLDHFVQRQLNDTRYIARALSEYLRCLVAEPHHVLCPKGSHTAELRRHWGLNTVLQSLPDSPAWTGESDLRDGEKNRSDHRHHAIDALVIALTDASRLQTLARIRRQGGTENTGEVLADPWPNFRQCVIDSVKGINVSHRVQRRVSGALHEDTLYGPVRDKNIRGELVPRPGEFVVRKTLESLTSSMVEEIRDPIIREIVIARLQERKVSFGRGVKGGIPKEVWTPQLTMKSGVPIRKVRLIKRDETIQAIRGGTAFVKPGSMHHLCVFEWTAKGKKKREAVFVTMLEAIQRIQQKRTIISRVHPSRQNARFVMSLSAGEAVIGVKGGSQLMIFSTAASTQGQVYFNVHSDARRSSNRQKFVVTANSMDRDARKVTVDPLGRIRWAND